MPQDLDTLISQPQLRQLLGSVSDTTIWRWKQAGRLPAPISINGRNYYRASEIRKMQAALFETRQAS